MQPYIVTSSEIGQITAALLQRNAAVKFSAPGHSMSPTILDGDVISVAPVQSATKLGDVLLYKHASGHIIAHRVIRIHPHKGYLLCGDALNRTDGWISRQQVIGIITGIERAGKHIRHHPWQSLHMVLKKNLVFAAKRVFVRG